MRKRQTEKSEVRADKKHAKMYGYSFSLGEGERDYQFRIHELKV